MTDNPSFVLYVGDGATTDRVFPFSYLDADHIAVSVDGVETAFTLISQNTVRISPAPAGSTSIRIERVTPGEALVTWNDGAVILGKDLNKSSTQPRFIAEEARDVADEAKEIAQTSIAAAIEAASDAEAAAAEALTSKTVAAAAATAAGISQTASATSATTASGAASTATTKASEAAASATTSTTKAGEAAASATTASGHASTATTKAAEAAASATAASGSATAAAGSASTATAAAGSAAGVAAAVAAIYDQFDDRYLGPFATNPTLDNDGNALSTGALYFNTTGNELRIWTAASAWVSVGSPVPGGVTSWNSRIGDVDPQSGDYAVADITGLSTALAGKADDSEITTLTTAVAGKAATVHTHAQSDITGLSTALAGKADDADIVAVDPRGKQTMWVPAGAMYTSGLPSSGVLSASFSAAQYLAFDPTSGEAAFLSIAMPKGWDEGQISAQFYWAHPATTTNFGVSWRLAAAAYSNDDAFDGSNFAFSAVAADTGGTTSDVYISPETAAFTIGNSPAEGDLVNFRVERVPGDASDTLAVDAYLIGVKIFYTTSAATDA